MHEEFPEPSDAARITGLEKQAAMDREMISGLKQQVSLDRANIARLEEQDGADRERVIGLEAQAVVDHEIIAALAEQGLLDRDQIAHLRVALATARRIGAAVGILMATHKVDEEAAFVMLRDASQSSHVKLRELAESVLFSGALDT